MPPSGMAFGARLIAKELQLRLSSEARSLYFHGQSMAPFLVEGDEVVVAPVAWRHIRIGDVVTYRYDDKFPTRRVVWRTHTGVHLWCENWPERRFYAVREDVLARAMARRRGGAWITHQDPEWKAARRAAFVVYARRVAIPWATRQARRIVVKILRLAGLRRPPAAQQPDVR